MSKITFTVLNNNNPAQVSVSVYEILPSSVHLYNNIYDNLCDVTSVSVVIFRAKWGIGVQQLTSCMASHDRITVR